MNVQNDPIRLHHALIRLIAAVLAAVLLLAVSGFGAFKLLRGAETFDTIETVQSGDYVERDIYLILDYFASGYRNNNITEKYAVVPINGQMVAFCFPTRWFESADAIQSNSASFFSGTSATIDQYIRVTGTVQDIPEEVSDQLYSWFSENKDWMAQAGMISEVEDYADFLPEVVIQVDAVGSMPSGWVVTFSVVAALCLIYAVIVLVRIALKKYRTPDITVEITEASENETGDAVTVERTEEAEASETSEMPEAESAEIEETAGETSAEKEETLDEDT